MPISRQSASQLVGVISHEPGSKLPLISTRTTVAFPAIGHYYQ